MSNFISINNNTYSLADIKSVTDIRISSTDRQGNPTGYRFFINFINQKFIATIVYNSKDEAEKKRNQILQLWGDFKKTVTYL
jgi:hypothetical protein